MSGLVGNPFLLTSAGAAGYQISRSLRFNSSDSAYCSRTFTTPTASNRWTWAGWIKRVNTPAVADVLFSANYSSGLDARLSFASDNTFLYTDGGGPGGSLQTAAVYRDFSSWMHVVFVYDSPNATSTDRLQLYINGTRITTANGLGSATYPTQNTASSINGAKLHTIGQFATVTGYYANMYLADVHFIDGQALTPSSFTEVSATTGQLIPKAYSGTFTGNSFWLKFADNSAATATTLGKDSSGLGNNWTPNNFSVINNTQRWSRYFSVVGSGSSNVNGTELQAFDSDLSTFNGYSGALLPSNYLLWSSPVTFTNAAVRVRVNQGDLGTGTLEVNGASRTITNAQGVHWEDFGTLSTFNFVKLGLNSQPSNGTYIYAVEVNGSILVDSVFNYGNDSLVDTPTSYGTDTGVGGEVRGNYATLNPLKKGSNITLTNGNLDASTTLGSGSVHNTIGVSSGKWYWECTLISGSNFMLGIAKGEAAITEYTGQNANSWSYYSANGNKYTNSSASSYGAVYTANDVIGVALDADNGTLTFYKNGVSQGQAYSGLTSGPYFASCSDAGGGSSANSAVFNFGQRPFAYTAPSGFKALCDTNLPAPVVAKPNEVMDIQLWTGNGSAGRAITGYGFSPDLVWIKSRSAGYSHALFDTVRGVQLGLQSNATNAEISDSDALTAFNSNGFTVGTGNTIFGVNTSSQTFVGWAWDAGSSTVTNTAGSITSQVRANASAGFSIVAWTPQSGSGTVGHGLNVAPEFIITKDRDSASEWFTYHKSLGAQNYLVLNLTNGITSNSTVFSTIPTSTVFDQGTGFTSGNGYGRQICYCFAPVAGYSSFGSYTGNGSADGPFVYTGFRPRWILYKVTNVSANWIIFDTARDSYNLATQYIYANTSNAEASFGVFDILSNGFKLRTSDSQSNGSANTYIYAAFAESPFAYSRAR